jgi:hypothetical protein
MLDLRWTGVRSFAAVNGRILQANCRQKLMLPFNEGPPNPPSKAQSAPKLFVNNNYHAVHHDLPQVPWFALRQVYEASRQQYIERSGCFLVEGCSEWLRLYAFAPVASPVYGDRSDLIPSSPPASDSFAGKLRVKLMVVVRRGQLHEADLTSIAERKTARQAL